MFPLGVIITWHGIVVRNCVIHILPSLLSSYYTMILWCRAATSSIFAKCFVCGPLWGGGRGEGESARPPPPQYAQGSYPDAGLAVDTATEDCVTSCSAAQSRQQQRQQAHHTRTAGNTATDPSHTHSWQHSNGPITHPQLATQQRAHHTPTAGNTAAGPSHTHSWQHRDTRHGDRQTA